MKKLLFTFTFGLIVGLVAAGGLCYKINEKRPGAITIPPPAGVPDDSKLAVVGSSPELVIKQTIESGPERPREPLRRAAVDVGTESFIVDCADWSDSEGRFYFHQDTRKLDFEQHLYLQLRMTQDATDHIHVDADLVELSPRTGDEISRNTFDTSRFTIWQAPPPEPPKWTLSAGVLVGVDGADPYLIGQRHFGRFVSAGVLVTPDDAIAFGGVSFSF